MVWSGGEVPATITGDLRTLRIVVRYVLENAFDFLPDDAKPRLRPLPFLEERTHLPQGLGLSFVKAASDLHKGTVTAPPRGGAVTMLRFD